MPQKLENVQKYKKISNDVNRQLIDVYHKYLISTNICRNYQITINLIYMIAKVERIQDFYESKDYFFKYSSIN